MSLPFIKKYEPKEVTDIVGQDTSINSLNNYIKSYKKQKNKAALLFGPPGTGKTSSVYVLANDYEIIEVNASDFRNKDKIKSIVGNALNQGSLFGKSKLILIDEIDGLSGTKDRGATTEIISLIKSSTYPVILTAQDPFDKKFNTIRKNTEMIAFKELDHKSIFTLLEKVCKKEKIKYDENALKSLARLSGGDARCALNDLEGITAKNHEITRDDLNSLATRDKEESILQALVKILKNSNAGVALGAFDNVKEDLDQRILWLDHNMPLEYTNAEDRAKAYYYMSRADLFKKRIRRWQHWRFLVYINAFLTAGIATSKKKKYDKFLKYERTGRLLKMFWAKQKSFKKKSIAEKIAKHTHSSSKQILKDFDYYKLILKRNKNIQIELDLEKEEVAWLGK